MFVSRKCLSAVVQPSCEIVDLVDAPTYINLDMSSSTCNVDSNLVVDSGREDGEPDVSSRCQSEGLREHHVSHDVCDS
jgi:hypothetical protein